VGDEEDGSKWQKKIVFLRHVVERKMKRNYKTTKIVTALGVEIFMEKRGNKIKRHKK
jgi:hypothetical protein